MPTTGKKGRKHHDRDQRANEAPKDEKILLNSTVHGLVIPGESRCLLQ